MEIITYATHSFGLFDKLINNEYNIPIKVLGWKKKWNGFTDKYKGILDYIAHKNDTDIVIFLDGFDTKINKEPIDLLKLFKSYNCKILFSKELEVGYNRIVFPTCKNKKIANTGMYMGYVKELKEVLNFILKEKCSDDQVILNKNCNKFNFIKIDTKELIFENIFLNKNKKSNAIFVQYPSDLNIKRIKRSISEYYQFFFIYIQILFLGLMYMFPKYIKIFIILFIFSLLLYSKSSIDCVVND
jgi:hypothetical protein